MKFGDRVIAPVLVQAAIAAVISALLAVAASTSYSSAEVQAEGNQIGWAVGLLVLQIVSGAAFLLVAYRKWRRLNLHLRCLPLQVRSIARGKTEIPGAGTEPPEEILPLVRSMHRFAKEVHQNRAARSELEKMAQTDPLTGLPNRRGLLEFMNKVMGGRRGWIDPGMVGVMHVDLDHFKTINDTLGHDAGDHVLREATKLMQSTVRDSDLIARLGGDEFALVLPGIESIDVLERLAERLIEKFEPPIPYGDELCRVGISIGVVLGDDEGEEVSPTRLLTYADIALTHAKAAGRGRHSVFSPSMANAEAAKTGLATEIRQGLLDEAFYPAFQPFCDMRSKDLTGVTVVPRWRHPERGDLTLDQFENAAETHNMIEEIGLQVLERACDAFKQWRSESLDPGIVSIGLSRSQLLAPGVVDKVSWVLDDAGIAPEQLAISVSEADCQGAQRRNRFQQSSAAA